MWRCIRFKIQFHCDETNGFRRGQYRRDHIWQVISVDDLSETSRDNRGLIRYEEHFLT